MGAPAISSVYQQYKADTARIANCSGTPRSTWAMRVLTFSDGRTTRTGLGAGQGVEGDGEQGIGIGRTSKQMRNARKKANAKAKARAGKAGGDVGEAEQHPSDAVAATATQPADPPTFTLTTGNYALRVSDYVVLARYLASQAVSIPVELIKLLKRCIRLRQRSCRDMANVKEATVGGHEHFVKMLMDVLAVFESGGLNSVTSSNAFSALSTDEDGEDMADIQLPPPPPPPNAFGSPSAGSAKITFSVAIDRDEAAFRVLAFYADVHAVRDHLKQIWADYKAGNVDLVTASVITNTALERLRKPHDNLVQRVLPVLGGDLHMVMIIIYNWLKGFNSELEMLVAFPTLNEDDRRCELYDYLLIPNLQMLAGLAQIIKPGTIPSYKAGHFGTYDPHAKATHQQRWKQNQILLCESLSEYIVLAATGDTVDTKLGKPDHMRSIFAYDELVLVMDELAHTGDVSLFTMLCSQVFFDMDDVLRDKADRGLADMKAGLKVMSDSWKEYHDVSSRFTTFRPEGWPRENDPIFRALQGGIDEWRTKDIISNVLSRQFPGYKSHLLSRSPLLCGQILFSMQLSYQHAGLIITNSWYSILGTAHLYVAAQAQAKRTDAARLPDWPDMQAIIDLHGLEDMFHGKTPETVQDALSSYMTMLGFSKDAVHLVSHVGKSEPVSKSRLRRAEQDPGNVAYTRGLVDHAHLVPIFRDKYATIGARRDSVDIIHVEAMLKDMGAGISAGGTGLKLRRGRKHKSAKFSIIQLLSVLELGLESESASLRFDYISMHNRCLRILKSARDRVDEYLTRKQPDKWPIVRNNLSVVVLDILEVALYSARASEIVGIASISGVRVGSKVMLDAEKALREVLTKGERDVEVKKMGMARYGKASI